MSGSRIALFLQLMKLFAFIMSLLVFIQSALPCMDEGSFTNVKKSQAVVSGASGESHSGNTDGCSPFCTCSCCASASCTNGLAAFEAIHFTFRPFTTDYLPASLREVALPIWQPPQLLS